MSNKRPYKTAHKGEKPLVCIVCKLCDSSFATKQSLKKHIESLHEGKKPFECSICNAKIAQKGHLNYHILYVHGEKKHFQCSQCGSEFKHKYSYETYL